MNARSHLFAAALLAAPLFAQQLQPGLQSGATPLPLTAGNLLSTPAGLVSFDGTALTLTPDVGTPQTLLSLPSSVFGSFTIAAGPNHVLFGESSTNAIWLVPLAGPAPTAPLASMLFNYDAVLLSPNTALVSAKTSGFSTNDNDLVALNLTTGQQQIVATVPGASGPVALAANGDVFYATSSLAFPTPPGTVDLLRFPRAVVDAAIQNSTVLGVADAQLVIGGLDAAADLAVDDDGDVLFTDWMNGTIGEVNDAATSSPSLGTPLVDYTGASVSAGSLQFVPAATPGGQVFEPFQPLGGQLLVSESDFFTTSQLRAISASPASLTVPGPAPVPTGAFQFVAAAGPANGIGIFAFDTLPPSGPVTLTVPGFEAPIALDGTLLTTQILLLLPFDANGDAVLPVVNPGFAPALQTIAQVVFVTADNRLGATPALPLLIGQ